VTQVVLKNRVRVTVLKVPPAHIPLLVEADAKRIAVIELYVLMHGGAHRIRARSIDLAASFPDVIS